MITRQDFLNILSESYSKASLAENCNMRLAADLFECVREQLDISDPYATWNFIKLDRVKFDNDYALKLFADLKVSYFYFLFEKVLIHLSKLYKKNKKEGLELWYKLYAEAIINFRDDMICMLCYQAYQWGIKDTLINKISKLPSYLRENRWPDAFPFYKEIADNKSLTDEVRVYAEIILMEINLYYYPESSRLTSALKHLENARAMLPDHFITEKGKAIYYFKTGETQKARDSFLQLIAIKPGNYDSFNLIGDCFLSEAKLESAESWYKDAININCHQTESYTRLINLYGNKIWFREKESVMTNLIKKIKTRINIEKKIEIRYNQQLIERKRATKDCFMNLILYYSYRDMGAAWYAVQNFKKSEEWYKKAKKLQPELVQPILDLAYTKLNQKLPDKAFEYFLQALEKDKNYFDVYLGLAFYYKDHGQKEKALSNFNKCLYLRPDWNDWVYNYIGNLFFSNGEYNESETYYRKAVDINNSYLVFRQNLAGALIAQADQLKDSNHKEAEKLYLNAVAFDNDANRWNTLGNFYFGIKQWKEAADCFDKAIALDNTNLIYHENRGLAYENLNEYAEAEKSYKQALEIDGDSGRLYNRLGVLYYHQKQYEQSLDFYNKALEREPKQSVYLDNICLVYEQLNQLEKAEPYYQRLLEIEPNNDYVLNQLGILYYKINNYEKAREYYNNAIKNNPGETVYYGNLSILYSDQGQYPEAIKALQKAIDLQPENAKNWNNMGVLYFNLNDYDKALQYFNKVLDLKSDISETLYVYIALAYDMKQQSEEAIRYFQMALQINPKNALTLNRIGVIYFTRKQYELAIANYRQAVALENNNGIYQINLAMALVKSGLKDEARIVYQKAIELKGDDWYSWNDLGVLYYEKGDTDKAIDCYNRSINLKPDDPILYSNLALAFVANGNTKEAMDVITHPLLNDEVRRQVKILLQQNLPNLFEIKL